jgi:hypothetical protein
MFSSIVFYCEEFYREIYGDTGVREFTSIPGTFWWSMVTLSTIGYGDKVPKTPFGKISAGVLMGCAIVFMSLPISVVGTQFTQHWVNYKKQADREERTAIAFDKLSELVDNLVDHFKVGFSEPSMFPCAFLMHIFCSHTSQGSLFNQANPCQVNHSKTCSTRC